jgi:hypothetical protein
MRFQRHLNGWKSRRLSKKTFREKRTWISGRLNFVKDRLARFLWQLVISLPEIPQGFENTNPPIDDVSNFEDSYANSSQVKHLHSVPFEDSSFLMNPPRILVMAGVNAMSSRPCLTEFESSVNATNLRIQSGGNERNKHTLHSQNSSTPMNFKTHRDFRNSSPWRSGWWNPNWSEEKGESRANDLFGTALSH